MLHGNDDKLTVLALIGAVGADHRVVQTDAGRRFAKIVVIEQRNRHPVGHHVEHGHRNAATFAGALTPDQRFADPGMGCHARGDVADRHANPPRPVRRAGHRCQAAFALHQKVIGLGVAHRAVFAVSGDVASHETREPLSQTRGIQTQLCQGARQKILNEHIRVFQHFQQDIAIFCCFDIQCDRFLAPV